MRTLPLTAACAVVPLLLALLVAGCKIDGERIEKSIVLELEKQKGIKAKSAACPKDITEKKDGSFQCTVTLDDGATLPIEVKMLGEGNVKWTLAPPAGAETQAGAKNQQ